LRGFGEFVGVGCDGDVGCKITGIVGSAVGGTGASEVSVTSLQPQNRPGVSHVFVLVVVVVVVVVVMEVVLVVSVVVILSLQPNHPGVLHVDVDEVVVVVSVMVVLSRQPHHPGVWHVAVRVRVKDDVEEVVIVVDVVSEPLLSYILHPRQSRHSGT